MISCQKAAEVALEIVDEVGLDNLSLTKVAQRLGVKSPSLYYHFHDKDALLAEVARILLLKIPNLHPDDRPFEEWIVSLCIATRRTILRHPNAAPLMLQFFPRHLLLEAYERTAKTYTYPPAYKLAVLEGTEKLTFGSALFAAAAVTRGRPPMPAVDPSQQPHFSEALESNAFDDEALFAETLRMYLAGAAARVERGELGQAFRHQAAE